MPVQVSDAELALAESENQELMNKAAERQKAAMAVVQKRQEASRAKAESQQKKPAVTRQPVNFATVLASLSIKHLKMYEQKGIQRLRQKLMLEPGLYLACVFSFISILLTIVQNELLYVYGQKAEVYWLKGCTSLISICLSLHVVWSYRLSLRQSFWEWRVGIATARTPAVTTAAFLVELCINIVHAPPGIETTFEISHNHEVLVYELNSAIVPFVMMKSYWWVRGFVELYRYQNPQVLAHAKASAVLAEGIAFNLRLIILRRPFTFLLTVFMLLWVWAAYMIRILELPVAPEIFIEFSNCMWVIIVTITTVGYGDIVPASHMGRLAGFLALFVGLLITALIITVFSEVCKLRAHELRFICTTKKFAREKLLMKEALKLLQVTWRRKRERKLAVESERIAIDRAVQDSMTRFRAFRKKRQKVFGQETYTDILIDMTVDKIDDVSAKLLGGCGVMSRALEACDEEVLKALKQEVEYKKNLEGLLVHLGFSRRQTNKRSAAATRALAALGKTGETKAKAQ